MPRRVSSLVALVGAAAIAALPSASVAAEAADPVRGATRSTSTAFRCGTAASSSRRCTCRRTPERQALPDPDDPHALQRRALRDRRLPRQRSGPSEAAAKEGFIFVHQDVRGRFMSEGEFVDVRPFNPAKGPTDVDESTDACDTIDWLVKKCPRTTAKVGSWGISYPGFYAAMAGDRRPPRARRRLAAGADRRLVRRRRLPPQRGLLPAARLQLLHRLRQAPPRADHEVAARASTTAPPTATTSSSGPGRCRTSTGSTSRATSPSGRRSWRTRPTTTSGRRATPGRT